MSKFLLKLLHMVHLLIIIFLLKKNWKTIRKKVYAINIWWKELSVFIEDFNKNNIIEFPKWYTKLDSIKNILIIFSTINYIICIVLRTYSIELWWDIFVGTTLLFFIFIIWFTYFACLEFIYKIYQLKKMWIWAKEKIRILPANRYGKQVYVFSKLCLQITLPVFKMWLGCVSILFLYAVINTIIISFLI